MAALAGRLSAATVRALADESGGPVGRLLGIPADGGDQMVAGLKQDIANARGKTALHRGWRLGQLGRCKGTALKSERFGSDPPASLVELVDVSSRESLRGLRLQRGPMGRLELSSSSGSMAISPIRRPSTPGAVGGKPSCKTSLRTP